MGDKEAALQSQRQPWDTPRLVRLGAIRNIAGPAGQGTQSANVRS
jgi:hypothetical protein